MRGDDLPSGWTNAAIDRLLGCDGVFIDGDWVESKDQDPDGDVRLIQLADVGDGEFRDRSARFLTTTKAHELGCTFLEKGDLLIARMPDPLGRCCIFPLDDTCAHVTVVDVCIVRVGTSLIESKYLMYAFNSGDIRNQIADLQSGSTRKRISRGNLATIELPIAPLAEQRRLVAKIEELYSELDKGVEALIAAREQLKAYRQSVLKHAFEGKLTEDWRTKNADKLEAPETLLARIKREREARYQQAHDDWESALATWRANGEKGRKPPKPGRLPDFDYHEPCTTTPWPTVRVEAVLGASLINGRSVKDRVGGFPVLRLTALKNGRVVLTERKEGDWSVQDASPFLVERNDIFLARGNGSKKLVGIGGRVIDEPIPVAFPDTMIRVRLDQSVMRADFFLLVWNSSIVRSQIEETARTTAGIYKINQDHVSAFKLPLPSVAEQAEIVRLLEEKLEAADVMEAEIEAGLARAASLRQSILKCAFSGKLVPQDPKDEPAAALLARIKAERVAEPIRTSRRKREAAE